MVTANLSIYSRNNPLKTNLVQPWSGLGRFDDLVLFEYNIQYNTSRYVVLQYVALQYVA